MKHKNIGMMERGASEHSLPLVLSLINFNKIGKYYEGEDTNTTLPIEHNEIRTVSILDCGAGISNITKEMCKQ